MIENTAEILVMPELQRLTPFDTLVDSEMKRPTWCPLRSVCVACYCAQSTNGAQMCWGAGIKMSGTYLGIRHCTTRPGSDKPIIVEAGGVTAAEMVVGYAQAEALHQQLRYIAERLEPLDAP